MMNRIINIIRLKLRRYWPFILGISFIFVLLLLFTAVNLTLVDEASEGNVKATKLLIRLGGDINGTDNGRTALIYALEKGNISACKLILNLGGDPNISYSSYTNIDDPYTPLMMASEAGYTDVVKMMIQRGANVNARCNDGTTAIAIAKLNKQIDIVNILRSNGAKE